MYGLSFCIIQPSIQETVVVINSPLRIIAQPVGNYAHLRQNAPIVEFFHNYRLKMKNNGIR
ncbi:hypothetical protein HZS_592 [Henneguya salminicola]|nr:hypothetical protein HZS_592 [Henneguya salminicola]